MVLVLLRANAQPVLSFEVDVGRPAQQLATGWCGRRSSEAQSLGTKISRPDHFLVPGALLCAVGIIGTSAKFSAPLGAEAVPRRFGGACFPGAIGAMAAKG